MGRSRPRKGKLPRPRKSAENLEEIFRIVSETASDAILAIDERGVIIFANPTTEKIFGYSARELLGREITTLMPGHLREVYRRSFSSYLETDKKHISWAATPMTGLRRDGSEFPLEISIGESLRKGKRIFTGIARDVSDRHRVLRDLMHSEEKYAKMVQASPDAITLRTFPGRRYIEAFCRRARFFYPSPSSARFSWRKFARRLTILWILLQERLARPEKHPDSFARNPLAFPCHE